jgi:hypothetical protein
MPAEYDSPISVRKRPMPTPVAVLMVEGISLTSHCRMPVKARRMKMSPSRNTAVRAVSYEMEPLPLAPTTWKVKYAFRPMPGLVSALTH